MNNVRIQDDLYDYVNGEWMEKAIIPDDKPTTGGFSDLNDDVEARLMADFKAFAAGEKSSDVPAMADAVRFYKKVLDAESRNAAGIEPILPLLNRIAAISSPEEFNEKAFDLALDGAELPLQCAVTEDMQDATRHAFIVLGPNIILPDTTYYENPQGQQLLQLYAMMVKQVLAFTPLSGQEQEQYLQDTLAFDALVAKKVKSQLEWADYVKNHNPMDVDEVQGYVAPFDLKGFLAKLYGEEAPKILVVYDPRAIKEFNGYYSAETFPLFKHWCYVKTLLSGTAYLSLPLAELGRTYQRALTGVASDPVLEKQAYRAASRMFSEPIGVYYGRTYFGEEAKKDIVSLVHRIIDMYKQRIRENGFLAETTKDKAVLKLSTMAVKMGYPDGVREYFTTLTVNEEDSYYETMCKLGRKAAMHMFEKLNKPVDPTEWAMPGHMVNACYNPSQNDITFPAAILQKPFYSITQSISQNLGGIGAVIGHEISHAFDNNGAQFDEHGNLSNWWTEKDYEAFKTLTKQMVEQWDGIPFHGGAVKGELVVSENIADNGGMAVTLAIMKTIENADYEEYFQNWARVWCQKAREEYIQLLLNNDVHSPAKLRANMQPRNFPEWYATFGVSEKDAMFIPEEKRIIIW